MANKENLSPRTEGRVRLNDERSTPPGNIPASLGIKPWLHNAYMSPPFGLLSPNSKPSLARQRDHSACRVTDSPLKVRKTRENLKQASIYGDIPAPCMHGSIHGLHNHALPPSLSFTSATTVNSRGDGVDGSGQNNLTDLTGSTLVSDGVIEVVPTPPPLQTPSRIARHKSVSRRVLSRVKEGITQRSRSTYGTRVRDSESSLVRRLSGKRKSSNEVQTFEVSRDSIDSEPDDRGLATTPQRSFTDCSIVTNELMGTGITVTPPSSFGHGSRNVSTNLLSPHLAMRSPEEPTPRANHTASAVHARVGHIDFQASLPYIDVTVSVDREAVDVGVSQDVWVAVEAVARTRIVETTSSSETQPTNKKPANKKPIDVVIILCKETLAESAGLVQQCIIELYSRLDEPSDRVSFLLASSNQIDASTVSCTCAQLQPLQTPRLPVLLERLGLAPGTTRDKAPPAVPDQPIQTGLAEVDAQGPREGSVHGIVLSHSPAYLAQAIKRSTTWEIHLLRIGLRAGRVVATGQGASSWSFDVRHGGDLCASSLDNMFRDLRQARLVGKITSLRICYKAMERSRIVEVVGEKAVKDLQLGQRCSLFLKICLPKIDVAANASTACDQNSLFAELESIVGTLETNFLHVEARYRHTALPTDHVVTIRKICTMRRPKIESRWSLISSAGAGLSSEHVNMRLTAFLLSHYATLKAVDAISRWGLDSSPAVQQMCDALKARVSAVVQARSPPSPTVIVTDTSSPAVPHTATRTSSATVIPPMQRHNQLPHSASASNMITTRIISAPKGTTAISTFGKDIASSARDETPSDANDTAHQLWQHLRRNSLSSKQILEAMSHEELQQLEANDDDLKVLRGQALANKRSVGADTLREWKWTDNKTQGVAPWL